jgi:Kef-type K+ transport system membrane component KefB
MSLLPPWTREDVRAMLDRPAIIVTGILCATVLLLSFVAALTLLAYNGRSTEVLTMVLIAPLVGLLVAVLRRIAKLEEKATQIQTQTNGAQTRLIEAVVAAPAQPVQTEVS